jgi:hypothetical protein
MERIDETIKNLEANIALTEKNVRQVLRNYLIFGTEFDIDDDKALEKDADLEEDAQDENEETQNDTSNTLEI